MAYRVRRGGSPMDSGVVLFDIAVAEKCALNMARQVAKERGDFAGTIDMYGAPGDPVGWGACPENNEGGYYPIITEEP